MIIKYIAVILIIFIVLILVGAIQYHRGFMDCMDMLDKAVRKRILEKEKKQ